MKVYIKKLNEELNIPYKKHESDYCFDCWATSCKEVAPNVYEYGLGFAIQISRSEFSASCATLRARSSIWKTGMVLSNSVGTIDLDYQGEIKAVFYHVMPNMPKYEVGDRVCQIHLDFSLPIEWVEVEDFEEETERGAGGYGSTGLR